MARASPVMVLAGWCVRVYVISCAYLPKATGHAASCQAAQRVELRARSEAQRLAGADNSCCRIASPPAMAICAVPSSLRAFRRAWAVVML